jgi:hypothetical protein
VHYVVLNFTNITKLEHMYVLCSCYCAYGLMCTVVPYSFGFGVTDEVLSHDSNHHRMKRYVALY